MSTLKVADLFCGAGGFSEGMVQAARSLKIDVELVAVNHWDVAIATHLQNHPTAVHLCANAYRLAPKVAVPGGKLDLLLASPTCTFNSRARGGKPSSWDQKYGRMTPTQVVRWCRELDVQTVVVENVPEFKDWGPVCRRTTQCKRHAWTGPKAPKDICGRPLKDKAGIYFRAWVRRLERLGFKVSYRVLNAADFGDATTRSRFFLIGRRDGVVRWPEETHSKTGTTDLFGSGKERWKAARSVIDWKLRGSSIFTRVSPLSVKTLLRILVGAIRHNWPRPLLDRIRNHLVDVAKSKGVVVEVPEIPARTAAKSMQALVVRSSMQGGNGHNVRSSEDPLYTVATDGGLALVLPQNGSNGPRTIDDPVPTITTTSRGVALVLPQHGGGVVRSVNDPLPTIATDGAIAMLSSYYGNGSCTTTEDPVPTVTVRDRFGLVVPVTHVDRSNRSRSVDDPLPTITGANRGELAFIAAAFGERQGQTPRTHSVDDPAPTICAKGRINLVTASTAPEWDVEFRMLQPHELAGAMGFEQDYVFTGNKTQRTRQVGNAVSVAVARALLHAVLGEAA